MESQEIYTDIVRGITELNFNHPAVPCQLLLVGPETVPICVNKSGHVLIAATKHGAGRIVVLAHEEYLDNPSFRPLMRNAVAWVSQNKQNPVVGIQDKFTKLIDFLEGVYDTVKRVSCVSPDLDVFCRHAYDGHHAEEMSQFVKSGGGLVIGGQAWHWALTNPGKDVLADFTGNCILAPAGIYFTDQYDLKKGILKLGQETPHGAVCEMNIATNPDDLSSLLKDVGEFQLTSSAVPSTLLVHGQLAFPVAQDPSGHTFIAAARYGRGRVVVVSHEGYLSLKSFKQFTTNAITWLKQGRPDREVCVHKKLRGLPNNNQEMKCKISSCLDGQEAVYCCYAGDEVEVEEVVQFVAEGGGLLVGGQSWWWAQTNATQEPLSCYPGNKYLNHFGISISPRTMKGNATYKATNPVDTSKFYHFRRELMQLNEECGRSNLQQAFKNMSCPDTFVEDCSSYLRMGKTHQNVQDGAIKKTLSRFLSTAKLPKPTEENPVIHSEEKFLMQLAEALFNTSWFGGKPSASLSSPLDRVYINGINKASAVVWRSTGLYVPPETQVTVTFPSAVTGYSWQLQVGCQTDDLGGSQVQKRPPRVTRRFDVTTVEVTVASLYGGLLYVLVPTNSNAGEVEVTVQGAIRAPYYQAGKTTTEEWLSTVRSHPAPWAELETDAIILSVPSTWVRGLEDPERLMQLWDKMMNAIFELAGTRLQRPERIVADVQIRIGSMHSGYPIMIHQKSIPQILYFKRITKKGCWGPIHELGHNQQRNQWEFRPHTAEATCNIWAVYVHETVLGIPRHEAHGQLTDAKRKKRLEDYVAGGAKLTDWKIWTCLETYLQLQEGFGWDVFPRIFRSYLETSCKDWTKQKKMTKWAEKFSLEVNMNLMPFFQAWGWSIDEPVGANVSQLPAWSNNPMLQFN